MILHLVILLSLPLSMLLSHKSQFLIVEAEADLTLGSEEEIHIEVEEPAQPIKVEEATIKF